MIAIDSSALMAIIGAEAGANALLNALLEDRDLIMSATVLAEVLVVADRRNIGDLMRRLLAQLSPAVIEADEYTATRVAAIYARWGKGIHPAGLNFVDCFSYDVARAHQCPLLYIGNDFSHTDIASAVAP